MRSRGTSYVDSSIEWEKRKIFYSLVGQSSEIKSGDWECWDTNWFWREDKISCNRASNSWGWGLDNSWSRSASSLLSSNIDHKISAGCWGSSYIDYCSCHKIISSRTVHRRGWGWWKSGVEGKTSSEKKDNRRNPWQCRKYSFSILTTC